MRLKCQHQAAAGKCAARRGDGRRHLRRVMSVVIDQREAAAVGQRDVAVALEAPARRR